MRKAVFVLFFLIAVGIRVSNAGCWTTVLDNSVSIVSGLEGISNGDVVSGSVTLTGDMSTICTACSLNCQFIQELNTDLKCVADLEGIFQNAVSMISSWGLDVFADWDFLDDVYNGFNNCEAAYEQTFGSSSSDNSDSDTNQMMLVSDSTPTMPLLQWKEAMAQQYMSEITNTDLYTLSTLVCVSYNGGTPASMGDCEYGIFDNWDCAYFSQCVSQDAWNQFWNVSVTSGGCAVNMVYFVGTDPSASCFVPPTSITAPVTSS
jgi:hypothetical protein